MTSASTTHADIFSLGKILQYMLVGSLNIPRKDLFPKSVKKEILKSIEKATAGEVTERYSSVVDFIDDLEEESTNTNIPEEGIDESQNSKPFDPNTFITKFLLTGFVFFEFVLRAIHKPCSRALVFEDSSHDNDTNKSITHAVK